MIALLRLVPAVVWVLAALIGCALLLVNQMQANGALREEVRIAKLEQSNAEAEKARAVEANRVQAKRLADARAQADATSRAISKAPDDDCLDRRLPDSLVDALRLPDPKGKKPPAAG